MSSEDKDVRVEMKQHVSFGDLIILGGMLVACGTAYGSLMAEIARHDTRIGMLESLRSEDSRRMDKQLDEIKAGVDRIERKVDGKADKPPVAVPPRI